VTAHRIGITGHSRLTDAAHTLVVVGLRDLLAGVGPLVGVSCLAPGSDQLFAEVVLELGGRLEVILPAADYREAKVAAPDRAHFDHLLERASGVRVIDRPHADRVGYRAANEALIASVDRLVAVWDGQPDAKPGGTADTVALAVGSGLPVTTVWPVGAQRT
jgi:hypothetical protein